ncbi:MAG: hypothetical protein ACI4WQ_00210, partial [Sharpea porci]
IALFNFSEDEQVAWINEEEDYIDLMTGLQRDAKGVNLAGHSFAWLLHSYREKEYNNEAPTPVEKKTKPVDKSNAEAKPAEKKAEVKTEAKPAAKKTEVKAEVKPAEKKAEVKAEAKPAEKKAEVKAETKPAEKKAEAKPAAKKTQSAKKTTRKPAAKKTRKTTKKASTKKVTTK